MTLPSPQLSFFEIRIIQFQFRLLLSSTKSLWLATGLAHWQQNMAAIGCQRCIIAIERPYIFWYEEYRIAKQADMKWCMYVKLRNMTWRWIKNVNVIWESEISRTSSLNVMRQYGILLFVSVRMCSLFAVFSSQCNCVFNFNCRAILIEHNRLPVRNLKLQRFFLQPFRQW